MKTIEQFEAEISQKIAIIEGQLKVFHDNLGRIGQVTGRDASEVYDKLSYHYQTVIDEMATTTRRNTSIMGAWVDTLDSILNVLAAVMHSVDAMEQPAENVDMLDVKAQVEQAIDKACQLLKRFYVFKEKEEKKRKGKIEIHHNLI